MIYLVTYKPTGVESQVTEQHYNYLKGKDEYSCRVVGADPTPIEPVELPKKSTDYTVSQLMDMDLSDVSFEGETRKTALKLID